MGISIDAKRAGTVARAIFNRTFRASWMGAARGAFMGKKHMVGLSPTDRGDLRRSWRVEKRKAPARVKNGRPALLINDAPHAGIIEGGARPHPVSQEGILSIAGWIARKQRSTKTKKRSAARPRKDKSARKGGDERKQTRKRRVSKSALRQAWAIAKTIEKEGQKPTFFVRRELSELADIAAAEVQKRIRRIAAKPPR